MHELVKDLGDKLANKQKPRKPKPVTGNVQSMICLFMDRDGVEVYKLAKQERGEYPVILTWRVIPSGQDSSILPTQVATAHDLVHIACSWSQPYNKIFLYNVISTTSLRHDLLGLNPPPIQHHTFLGVSTPSSPI